MTPTGGATITENVRGTPGWVQVPNALLDDGQLSADAVLLWALVRRRNGEGKRFPGSWESLATVARRLGPGGPSARRLRRAYDALLARGLLLVHRRGQGQTALRWALRPGVDGDRELRALHERGAIAAAEFRRVRERRGVPDVARVPNQDVAPVPNPDGARVPRLDVVPGPRNAEPRDAEPTMQNQRRQLLGGSAAGAERRTGATEHDNGGQPNGEPSPFAVLMPLVRQHFWAPDGRPPQGWTERREASVLKALLARAPLEQVAVWIEGLALLRDAPGLYADPVEWLAPGAKVTSRALLRKCGVATVMTLAHRAYWSAANRRPRGAPTAGAPVSIGALLARGAP